MTLFYPMPLDDYILQHDRIDIWEFSLANLPPCATSLLTKEEHERANRFYFERHQRRFIVARAMLRTILARYLKQDAATLSFEYNHHGKPQVQSSNLEFNLSHSAELALLAVGRQFPLGIDLEFFSARPYQGIAKNMFSPQEILNFSKLSPARQPLSFFHIWAQKEALIKACGLGLAYPTQQFDVPVVPPTNELIVDHKHQTTWQMISFMPQITCSAALCCSPSVKKINYSIINPLNFL
ncbi:4'-phosphopantetheinyl transferase family protein [Legionella cardiaca]